MVLPKDIHNLKAKLNHNDDSDQQATSSILSSVVDAGGRVEFGRDEKGVFTYLFYQTLDMFKGRPGHIMFLRKKCELAVYEPVKPCHRFKRILYASCPQTHFSSPSVVENILQTRKIDTPEEKFILASNLMKNVASYLSLLGDDDFKEKYSQLEGLFSLWHNDPVDHSLTPNCHTLVSASSQACDSNHTITNSVSYDPNTTTNTPVNCDPTCNIHIVGCGPNSTTDTPVDCDLNCNTPIVECGPNSTTGTPVNCDPNCNTPLVGCSPNSIADTPVNCDPDSVTFSNIILRKGRLKNRQTFTLRKRKPNCTTSVVNSKDNCSTAEVVQLGSQITAEVNGEPNFPPSVDCVPGSSFSNVVLRSMKVKGRPKKKQMFNRRNKKPIPLFFAEKPPNILADTYISASAGTPLLLRVFPQAGTPLLLRVLPKAGTPLLLRVLPKAGTPLLLRALPKAGTPLLHRVFPQAGTPLLLRAFPKAGTPLLLRVLPKAGTPLLLRVLPKAGTPLLLRVLPKAGTPLLLRVLPKAGTPLLLRALPTTGTPLLLRVFPKTSVAKDECCQRRALPYPHPKSVAIDLRPPPPSLRVSMYQGCH
ncbi:hypothetical protein Btru_076416 [Bulinus truncatus]|nr:hypothetical protein Btru_076416 [Bulinus truncatus]